MGVLTRGQIVTEGLLKAGKAPTSLSTRANTWLNVRIRSLEKGAPWPYLLQKRDGLALNTGAASASVGAGDGGVTNDIKLVKSPILIYASTYTTRVIAPITSVDGLFHDTGYDTAARRGVPAAFRVAQGTVWGKWSLIPDITPDRNLLLAFYYQEMSPALAADATVPRYPNDQTLIQAVMLDALIYMHGPDSSEAAAANDDYNAMVFRDRAELGSVPGTNDHLGLDGAWFR